MMKIDEFGSLLACLVVVVGMIKLPPLGIEKVEGVFVISWTALGTLIVLGFFRKIIRK